MLCIRKMDLVDLTARPFFLLFSGALYVSPFCHWTFKRPRRSQPFTGTGGLRWVWVEFRGWVNRVTGGVKAWEIKQQQQKQTHPGWYWEREGFHHWGSLV